MPCKCVLLAYLGLSTIWDGPARTLHFRIDSWQNSSWGFHEIDRQHVECEVAVAGDGSRVNACEYEAFRNFFFRQERRSDRTVYLRKSNAAFEVDERSRRTREVPCTCTWTPMTAIDDDSSCSRTAAIRLPGASRAGKGSIAGHEVVRYLRRHGTGETVSLSLAPGLACEVMEEVRTSYGRLRLPAARWHYKVEGYRSGEPNIEEFR